ncbi:unnamed protein product [Tenebrio molitor]|nr:unnamed protein product [Tenebrio molitor]
MSRRKYASGTIKLRSRAGSPPRPKRCYIVVCFCLVA